MRIAMPVRYQYGGKGSMIAILGIAIVMRNFEMLNSRGDIKGILVGS